jgi:hypothetical protein
VYCPRCGSPNEPGDRFCGACGAALRETAPRERRTPRDRLARLFGTTRRARLVSAATVVALVATVAAFIALNADEGIPRDAYTIAADGICLQAKREIVLARKGDGDPSSFSRSLVPIVGGWRAQLRELSVPPDRIEQARQLEAALLVAELRIAKLARVAERGDGRAALASAKRADGASAAVEEAVASLGLSECASAVIGFSPSPS